MFNKEFAVNYIAQVQAAIDAIQWDRVEAAGHLVRWADRVFLCGNGGSASLADHMATDLQLAGVQALALTNVAALTTYANDNNYTVAFSRQLEAMQPTRDDLLIAISTSGNSRNVLTCAATARACGMPVVALVGCDGGMLASRGYHNLYVSSMHTGVIQDVQQVLLHIIAYGLMKEKK